MATYGLRNHELFHLDFSRMPVLLVLDSTKTGFRRVYPLYPEWVSEWDLKSTQCPNCTGKTNSDLSSRVTHAFSRYNIPFAPLRVSNKGVIATDTTLRVINGDQGCHCFASIRFAWADDCDRSVHLPAHRSALMGQSCSGQPLVETIRRQ